VFQVTDANLQIFWRALEQLGGLAIRIIGASQKAMFALPE
jgi:lipase chaperone LimK